jgi:DNA uptake protein ComE-like DNA-binding protein
MMPKYVVKPGFVFGKSRQHKAGDVVEMSEAEALPFGDKLRLLGQNDGRQLTVNPAPKVEMEASVSVDAPLPNGFPHADKLTAGGYDTLTAVRQATDDDLLAVSGIGKVSLRSIREAQ